MHPAYCLLAMFQYYQADLWRQKRSTALGVLPELWAHVFID